MTPLELEILIHCYITLVPHPNKDAPAVKEAFDKFKADRIIEPAFNRLTKKGRAWLEVILNTPYPRVWPDKKEGGLMPEGGLGLCWKCARFERLTEKLEEIRCCIIDVEMAIEKLDKREVASVERSIHGGDINNG